MNSWSIFLKTIALDCAIYRLGCQPIAYTGLMATMADAKGSAHIAYVGLGISEASIAMGLHDTVDNYWNSRNSDAYMPTAVCLSSFEG